MWNSQTNNMNFFKTSATYQYFITFIFLHSHYSCAYYFVWLLPSALYDKTFSLFVNSLVWKVHFIFFFIPVASYPELSVTKHFLVWICEKFAQSSHLGQSWKLFLLADISEQFRSQDFAAPMSPHRALASVLGFLLRRLSTVMMRTLPFFASLKVRNRPWSQTSQGDLPGVDGPVNGALRQFKILPAFSSLGRSRGTQV